MPPERGYRGRPLASSSLRISRRVIVAAVAGMAVLVSAVTLPNTLGPRLREGLEALGGAEPYGLWLSFAFFIVSPLCSAWAWRTAIRQCGGQIGWCRAAASYGAGSLANFLLPARVGDGVRIALFSRALESPSAPWTSGGVLLLLGAVRAVSLIALVATAAAIGAVPLWPILFLVGIVSLAVGVALAVRRTEARSRFSHVLDAFRAFGRSPRACLTVTAWEIGSTTTRLAAATAVAAALGVDSPLVAAVVIVPALELAGLLPLTPGNLGITSGAVAVALRAHGIDLSTALSIGISLHAVEAAAGLSFGVSSLLYLSRGRSVRARRIATALSTSGAFAVAAAFAATMIA
jgi:uncharacterized membrane protein YbhN (UPF0104 family)